MAVINKKNSLMEFPLQIKRQYAGPIESNEIFYDLAAAQAYASKGATAYVGQTIKVVDETKRTVTTYTIQVDGTLKATGSAEHTHAPADIIETATKRFVSDTEKARWNDTYTKAETDDKLKTLVSGMEFRGTFETQADLPKSGCKDGWYAIVINDPALGKNVMFVYETKTSSWISLDELTVPGLATQAKDGLMSKEDKKKLDGMENAINTAKKEVTDKVTALTETHASDKAALEQKIATDIGAAKQALTTAYSQADTTLKNEITTAYEAADKTITDTVTAMDTAYKAEDTKIRKEFADADTALEQRVTTAYGAADTALKKEIDTAYQAADTALGKRIDALDTAYKAADVKINESISAMDTAYKAADTQLRKDFASADTALETQITTAYQSADNALESKITTAYTEADKTLDGKITALNGTVSAMDTAYKAADTKINGTISAMDTAYKAADTEIKKSITDMDTAYKAADTKLDEQIKAVDAKFVAATPQQIEALFA